MPLTQEERIMTLSPYLQEVAKRRTFAIISHPDAGKTTITEKVLLFGLNGLSEQIGRAHV